MAQVFIFYGIGCCCLSVLLTFVGLKGCLKRFDRPVSLSGVADHPLSSLFYMMCYAPEPQ